MVHSYAKLQTTPQVIQQDLGLAPDDFDKQYLAWIDKQVRRRGRALRRLARQAASALVAAEEQKQYQTRAATGPGSAGALSRSMSTMPTSTS